MQGFKSLCPAQQFLENHVAVYNAISTQRGIF